MKRLVMIIVLLFNSQLLFGITTGKELVKWCNDESSVLICFGYIMGAEEQQDMDMWMNESFGYCLPRITNGEKKQIIIKYAENHSEVLELAGFQLVAFAFQDAFPCTNSQLEERFNAIEKQKSQ